MKVIVTNPGRTFEERPLQKVPVSEVFGPIVELTSLRDQEILGFGAALTDAACVMLNRMPITERDMLLNEIFAPDQTNFSIARICVGSSDYAETVYHFAPVPDDIEMKYFDASHDDKNIIPVLRKVREINPELYIFSSPWSPPGWMKTSNQMEGGWMREKYLEAYANYCLKFLQYYMKQGIKINAITPQNETETDQISRMPACFWHPELEMKFAKIMRRLLDANGFKDVKIWLMDHNFVMWRRAIFEMNNPEVKSACAGIAWHPYEGYAEQINWFRRVHPECENHWTEGSIISDMYADRFNGQRGEMSFGDYAKSFIAGLENGCQSITVWNLALDEEGYPNVGPFNCRGIIEISRDGKCVKRSKEYFTLAHFSKYIKRGARRIIVRKLDVPPNFDVVAFENPDGTAVVVVANTDTYDSMLNLKVGEKVVSLRVLRESVSTVIL